MAAAHKVINIDVTLRDGGYRNGFKFDEQYAKAHVRSMEQCGVEYAEIGYRNGSFKPINGIGLTGMTPDSYITEIRSAVTSNCICVMAHPKNILGEEIVRMHKLGVDMLRFCWDANRVELTGDYVRLAKSLGMTVCVNLTRVSHQPTKLLLANAERVRDFGADVLYLADSNGSLTPTRVWEMVNLVRGYADMPIGFHAHDNLGLAMANSIAAIKAGATYIDGSLRGMGKGAGNLKLELWLAFLRCGHGVADYDHASMLDQVEVLEKADGCSHPIQPLDDLVLGLFDLTVEDKDRIIANAESIGQVFTNAAA
jgi:4-hydroxy 2-oxovalerate aldolase